MPKYGQYDVPLSQNLVNFGTGQPNNKNLPINWFQSVCKKMSSDKFGESEDEHTQFLQYGAISGYNDIKIKLSEWLSEKYYSNLLVNDLSIDYKISSKQIFMTNGNTGALHLLISKYSESGDVILVENPTYFIAINIFKEFGLKVESINMESDGANLSELDDKLKKINEDEETKQSVIWYYTIPTHHNPTGITLTHEKRKKLGQLCEKYKNLYVIADEVYHFLTFNNKYEYYPMADYHPKILSLGSFSKILAPALRVGWIYQNTSLENYKDDYGFVESSSGLNNSSVLDSSGGINPIGFKIIEYLLNDIDIIIKNHLNYLQLNSEIMIQYLSQYNNINFIKPKGGYFLWVELKTIKNTTEFLKICEKNKVKFHPGIKFSNNNNFTNFIRLSFSYYNQHDIIIGLERLMDCVSRYNKLNIKILGSSGKLGTLIKKEIINNSNIYYNGDIKRDFTINDFDGLIPYNSIIIDVSSNEGTYSLLKLLLKEKIYLPIIIGTTGLSEETFQLIGKYSSHCQIAHITNFSEGIPLFRNFAKLSNCLNENWEFNMTDIHHIHKKDSPSGTAKTIKNEINRQVNIKSIRAGETIGEHSLTLSNGSETLIITHQVSDRNTFAKGCLNYIFWILTKNNGFYTKIEDDDDDTIDFYNFKTETIAILKQNKDLPHIVLLNQLNKIKNSNKNLTKIITISEKNSNDFIVQIFNISNNNIFEIDFCGFSLLKTAYYIKDNYDISSGSLIINNDIINFDETKEYYMISLPCVNYIESNTSTDKLINDIINQMCNFMLFGVGRFTYLNNNYLILEIKQNIFESDMLETISTIINSDLSSTKKYNIIFINTKSDDFNTLYVRVFNSNNNYEVFNDCIAYSAVIDYYLYHFIKKYDESKQFNIKLFNNMSIKILYHNNYTYIYDIKKN